MRDAYYGKPPQTRSTSSRAWFKAILATTPSNFVPLPQFSSPTQEGVLRGLFYLLDLERDLLSSRLVPRRCLGSSSLYGLRGCLSLSAECWDGARGARGTRCSWKGAYLVSLSLSSSYIISSRARVGLVLPRGWF